MKRPHIKNSIRAQLACVFILMLIAVIGVSAFINTVFLQKYYIINKQRIIESAYDTVNILFDNYSVNSESFKTSFNKLTTDSSLSIVVADPGMTILCSTERESALLASRLLWRVISGDSENEPGYMPPDPLPPEPMSGNGGMMVPHGEKGGVSDNRMPFEDDHKKIRERELVSTEMYKITTTTDPAMRTDYIELWGYMSNGDLILIRTPLESIRESAQISNRFMLYIGILVAVMGAIVMWFVSKRITDPILELTDISDRMAHMDFEARYTSGGTNEIGALGEHMNEMSKRLEASISELKSANAELQQDIAKKEKIENMRSEFISNVSHELKTPIALISGYAEGLRDGIAETEEDRNEYLDVIKDESDKMGKLVSNLLELNKLEFGNEKLEMKRFDITELINNTIASAEIMIKQEEVSVSFNDEGPVYVWGDESRTDTVLSNYFTNAIRYCGGEKKIEITTVKADDGNIRIQVFNTGEPIPDDSIDRIWDKFYKVDKARSREVGGSGVGLSIVKAVMETLNKPYGVINYDNGVGFWFELERAEQT
ncbi:MAG: HAMP domain-containing histidine kinase [Lachnospiraceae bacterium]|nr:HAMP domain-containing histidine kinase [Lachnospiraceae bacterium]